MLIACSPSAFAQTAPQPTPRYTGTLASSNRKINSISLRGTITPQQTITCGTNSAYINKTGEHFIIREGETSTATFSPNVDWMHGYIYIDKNHDGTYNNIALGTNGVPTTTSELVAYSAYQVNGTYRNSSGATSGNNPKLNPPSFSAPTTAGIYYMRYMSDWNCIDPYGSSGDFQKSSGVAIDVTLWVLKEYTLTIVGSRTGTSVTIDYATEDSYAANGTVLSTNPALTVDDIHATDSRNLPIDVTVSGSNITVTFSEYVIPKTLISSLDEIPDNADGYYVLTADCSAPTTSINGFTGTLDGGFHTISGAKHAIFGNLNNATVKNIILDDVDISGDTNVGTIANTTNGQTRIYNCGVLATNGSSISGMANVGSIVGLLAGNTRVINCFSYADVSGSMIGGIVGNNSGTSATAATVFGSTGTLIMNCAYFGHLSGTNIYPIFGGNDINNVSGVNTYNYYIYDASVNYTSPNSAQGSEDKENFSRFDFYRSILNAHQELAAMYLAGTQSISPQERMEIAHWRYDDKVAEYLSLEPWPTNIRRTLDRDIPSTSEGYKGKQVGSIQATFIINGSSFNVTLPTTDMDTVHWDYTWGKVILPFANEFSGWTMPASGSNNYDNVVTGWEITSFTGGTPGTYANYNLCDPACTNKDLYANNNYVWAQGGNFVVPTGVTAVTFKAHIVRAVYLRDAYYDIAYNDSYSSATNLGSLISGTYNGKTVYTNLTDAFAQLENKTNPADQAIVLVGNYHFNFKQENSIFPQSTGTTSVQNKAVTIMSIDADNNQDPDYCFYQFHRDGSGRTSFPPVRFDFMASPGLAMASYTRGGYLAAIGIIHTKGWFEVTETCTLSMTEFEMRPDYFNQQAPIILNGGIYDRILMTSTNEYSAPTTKLQYTKIGGKAYVKDLNLGRKNSIPVGTNIELKPLNVSGGEIVNCHLTGDVHNGTTSNNVYFWCNGGYIHEFNGAYQEKVNGDVIAKMDHALIDEFYGGGADDAYGSSAQISGNINITCNNSYVKFFCGGPKFGNMAAGKTVTVNATGSTFDEYYGASYGGTALTKVNVGGASPTFSGASDRTFSTAWTSYTNARLENHYQYGIGVDFDMDYFPYAGGNNRGNETFYVYYASLSLAQTGDVTSTLTNCTINKDFYGGGCRGRVNGNVTSTLNGCTVLGNVFGGGFTPQATTCSVYPATQPTYPVYKYLYGLFTKYVRTSPYEEFTWAQDTRNHADASTKTLYTSTNMSVMGEVSGNTQLTINGNSQIEGDVFGGGNESKVAGTTTVNIETGNAGALHDIYGGANKADVGGATVVNVNSGIMNNVFGANNVSGTKTGAVTVNIQQVADKAVLVNNNVYGGGNLADYTGDPTVNMMLGTVEGSLFGGGLSANVTGSTAVNVSGGTVRTDVYGGGALADVSGSTTVSLTGGSVHDVYGGGLGRVADAEHGIDAVEALVGGNTMVTLNGSIVTGQIFGANNRNGTPQGSTKVIVQKTTKQPGAADDAYHVSAVYGGGNLAAHIPGDANLATAVSEVYVETCDNSIEYVYGGGNAASSPATKVTIKGGKMYYVFGGGNGAGAGNPGADVGYKDFVYDAEHEYGRGTTEVNIWGGVINAVFGGSNTKGNIRVSSNVNLDDKTETTGCTFEVGEVYGAGNEAEMYGNGNLVIGCIPGLNEIYGGAKNADLHGDVTLTITNGTFGKVFGGNNLGGKLGGSITVNIEETGCKPIVIGELYGGGNLAAYSVYGYEDALDANGRVVVKTSGASPKADPQVNIISCTHIGQVFGGGLGASAVMVGDPVVNIQEVLGKYPNQHYNVQTKTISSGINGEADELGSIGNVFGGGNEAKVIGNTTVNIATEADKGAYILGNVYGGGNQADVTGKTNVTVGH